MVHPLAEVFERPPDVMVLRSGGNAVRVRGADLTAIVGLMDGRNTVGSMVAQAGSDRVHALVDHLDARGLILWSGQVAGGDEDRERVEGGADAVIEAVTDVVADVEKLLCVGPLAGVKVEFVGGPGSLVSPDGAAPNGGSGPHVLLALGFEHLIMSPVLDALYRPCPDCFLRRMLSNDDLLAGLIRSGFRQRRSDPGRSPALVGSVSHLLHGIGYGIDRIRRAVLSAHVVTMSLASSSISVHRVVPYPSCVPCGAARARATPGEVSSDDTPTTAGPPPKGSPEGLWSRILRTAGDVVDGTTGIVQPPVVVERAGAGVYVAMTRHADPSPPRFGYLRIDGASGAVTARPGFSRQAFGSGWSEDDARARACMEALERYSCTLDDREVYLRASSDDLADQHLAPNDLMCYSDDQLRHRATGVSGDPQVPSTPPSPYDGTAALDWCRAVSTTGEPLLLPAGCCVRLPPSHPDHRYCMYDNNGCAAALTPQDAVVAGFLEVVERDAAAVWWYNRIPRPLVDPVLFDVAEVHEMVGRQRTNGREIAVFDITTDILVPVFAAVAHRAGQPFPLLGFGAHFDPRRALEAAILELGQALAFESEEASKWQGFAWRGQDHLNVERGQDLRTRASSGRECRPDAPASVEDCAQAAAIAGLDVLVFDCGRADTAVACVKVVVPGCRGFAPRFGPGRLFEVPVSLGWLPGPRRPAELNEQSLRS